MKIADIVIQLATIPPLLSADRYTEFVDIDTITGDGAEATADTAAAHGLSIGDPVYITNTAVETSIIDNPLNVGGFLSLETATNHDLTLGWPPHEEVTISGFTTGDYNGTFPLTAVPNRKNFTVNVGGSFGPIVFTGSEILQEIVLGGFNGTYQVTSVPSTTSFTFASAFTVDSIGGQAVTQIRIVGMENIDRAENEYSKQLNDKLWIFVTQPASVSISKDRRAEGDAQSEQAATTDYQLDILDGFEVYCLVPATGSKAGLAPSDLARDTVLSDLLKSVQRFDPPSGLSSPTPSRVIFTNHGRFAYRGAYYIHQYVFQIPLRMTTGDTVQVVPTVAFRDVDLTIQNDPEKQFLLTALIDLDVIPLD